MKRRILSAFTALSLMLTFLLPTAAAVESSPQEEDSMDLVGGVEISKESGLISVDPEIAAELPENDELFYYYLLLGDDDSFSPSTYTLGGKAYETLGETEKNVYNCLKDKITTVAQSGGSTVFNLASCFKTQWTKAELGVDTYTIEEKDGKNVYSVSEAAQAEIEKKLGYDSGAVMTALMLDGPLELYWFDKTAGVSASCQYGLTFASREPTTDNPNNFDPETIVLTAPAITLTFAVAQGYQNGDSTAVKSANLETVKTNAQKIVTDNASKSTYERLSAYQDAICKLVSYNQTAADDTDTPYGDPWQLINVFDHTGTDEKAVVCEGYSKAFQYLCDLSSFTDCTCYTVTGAMNGGKGEGPHMWNIVQFGNDSYLVDVTNSDTGTAGADGGLFLVGAAPTSGTYASNNLKYTFKGITYQYYYDEEGRTNQYELWDSSVLTLAATNCTPPKTVTQIAVTTNPAKTAYTVFEAFDGTGMVVTATYSDNSTEAVTGYTVEYPDNRDSFRVGDTSVTIKYGGQTATVTVTVNARTLTADMVSAIADQTYTGSAITPDVTVTDGSALTAGTDYTVAYKDNINAGTATATISGKGNYTGDIEKTFTITPKALTADMVAAIPAQDYTGSALTPDVTVKVGAKTLTKDTDYTVTLPTDVTSVGDHEVTITGMGNYTGTVKRIFTINGRTLTEAMVTVNDSNLVYTGSEIKPGVTVTDSGKTLIENTDYTVVYSKNINAGSDASVTITGMGGYSGTVTKPFTITPKALTDSMVTVNDSNLTYTGSEIRPAVTVTDGSTLTAGADYTAAYKDNINAGTATITITGMGNYSGALTRTFTIAPAAYAGTMAVDTILKMTPGETATVDLSALVPADAGGTVTYTAAADSGHADAAVAANGTLTLTYREGTDGSNASESTPETVTITVGGMANYQDFDIAVTIKYTTKDVAEITITTPEGAVYDGTKKAVAVTAKVGETDYSGTPVIAYYVSGETTPLPDVPMDAGTYTVTVSIDDETTTGTATANFTIAKKAITIKAKDQTVTVGASAPAAITADDYEVTGLVTGETISAPAGITYSSTDAPTTTGTITLTGPDSTNNYIITYVPGVLTVKAATVSVTGVTLSPTTLSLTVGQTGALTATVLPENATDKTVTWDSSDTSVATVNNGTVTAVKAGTATITVTTVDGSKTAACTVTVTETVTPVPPETSTCTVTFDANGGSVDTATLTTGADGKLASLPTPARSGCTFDGWYTASSGGTRITANTVFTENTTVYAHWTRISSGNDRPSGGGSGSSGGSGSTSVTVPVSGGQSSIQVSASVSGSTATVSKIDSRQFENVIGGDVRTGNVEIDFTGLDTRIDTVKLPAASIGEIAQAAQSPDNDVAGLTVKLSTGEITFNGDALAAIHEQAGSQITLTVTPAKASGLNRRQKEAVGDAPVFDLTLQSRNKAITDFKGGYATVSLPYTLEKGQDPAGIVVYYLDSDGNIHACETVCDVRTNTVIFTTGHLSLYFVGYDESAVEVPETPWENPFTDVFEGEWYYDAIRFVSEKGLMNGLGGGVFAPGQNLSRAQLAQILYNREGQPEVTGENIFTDVPNGKWYMKPVVWAASKGVVNGYGSGVFAPDKFITREELAVMLWRYAGSPAAATRELPFTDADSASGWALDALYWAVENRILNGFSGMLNPTGLATRAEAAQMLENYLGE